MITLLRLLLLFIGHYYPPPIVLWLLRFCYFLRFSRHMRIESAESGIIHGFRKQRQNGKELETFLWQSGQRGVEDVIALLDQIEIGKV